MTGYDREEALLFMGEATTAAQQGKHDLALSVSANPANGFTVYLPFCDSNLHGTIDWGDGTTEKVSGWNQKGASHQYAVTTTTAFEVRFSGVLKNISLETDIRCARENTLLAVKQYRVRCGGLAFQML